MKIEEGEGVIKAYLIQATYMSHQTDPQETFALIQVPEAGSRSFGGIPGSPDPLEQTISTVVLELRTTPSVVLDVLRILPAFISDNDIRSLVDTSTTPVTKRTINLHGIPLNPTPETIGLIAIPDNVPMSFQGVMELLRDYANARSRAVAAEGKGRQSGLNSMRAMDEADAFTAIDQHADKILDAVEAWIRYSFASTRMLYGTFPGSQEVSPAERFTEYQKAFITALNTALSLWIVQPKQLESTETLKRYSVAELGELLDSGDYSALRTHIFSLLREHRSEDTPLIVADLISSLLTTDADKSQLLEKHKKIIRSALRGTLSSKTMNKIVSTVQVHHDKGMPYTGYWLLVSPLELDKVVQSLHEGKRPSPVVIQPREVSDELASKKNKWERIVAILETLTRPVTYLYITSRLYPGINDLTTLKRESHKVSALQTVIKRQGVHLKSRGTGNKWRNYIGDDAKAEQTQSQVLTDFENEILSRVLDNHLRGIIGWLDTQAIQDQGKIPVRTKSVKNDDREFIQDQKVINLRASILGPIYDFAMALRSAADETTIGKISRPKGGYESTSYAESVAQRAAVMIDIMAQHGLNLVIAQDEYNAETMTINDPLWRYIVRTFDIAVRLGLNRDEFLEFANNSHIDRSGDEVHGVYIQRYKVKK